MKNTIKFFALLLFVMLSYGSKAQTIQTYGVSDLNTCNGGANFTDSMSYTSWDWMDANLNLLQNNGSNISNLCYGDYYLLATDSSGVDTLSFFIDILNQDPCSGFWAYLSPAAAYDSLCNGSASVAGVGGDGNYSFLWSTNETTYQISNLCPGNYSVTVTDGNGCIYDQFFTIVDSTGSGCNMQIYADSVVQLSNPNACDAYAHIGVYGGDGNYTYTWSNGVLGTNETYNLCAGTYVVTVTDGNGCSASTTITIYADTTSADCQNFYAYEIQNSPATDLNSCDGSSTITVMGGSGTYTIVWDNGLGSETATNLCAGYHTVSIYDDSLGCNYTLTVYTYGDSTNQNYDLDGYVYTYEPSADGQCDGSAYVEVWGGTAPYSFEHSNGDITQYPTNLCAGIYSVIVTDANGDSLLLNYIVPESNNIFNGGGFNDSTIVDTLYNDLIEDCLIDYLTLDTAFVSNVEYISNDSILVTWSVIDGNGTITFLQSYTISTGVGVYELILQIFCPQRSGTDYVYAIDQIYFNPALAKVDELKESEFSVYPNPFENNIRIDLDDNLNSSVVIRDITGKMIYNADFSSKNIEINVGDLAKGQYFLTVSTSKIQNTQLIIKK